MPVDIHTNAQDTGKKKKYTEGINTPMAALINGPDNNLKSCLVAVCSIKLFKLIRVHIAEYLHSFIFIHTAMLHSPSPVTGP